MTYLIPSKYGNEVCGECHDTTHKKYQGCTEPCSHLVSWASHKAAQAVIAESRMSVKRIKELLEREPDPN